MKTKQIVYLPLKKVIPDENQPRQFFDATKIASLANSIKRIGIKEPLVVEALSDGTYKLIDGERRFRAATLIGMTEVPALVEDAMTDIQRMVEQFHIQEQHEGWKPNEKAIAIRDIAATLGTSMKEVGENLGLSERTLKQYIAFASLLSSDEMIKSEINIDFSGAIANLSKHLQKQMLEQEGVDVSDDDEKEFQVAIIKRIKKGEIRNSPELTKVRDSLTQEAKKTFNAFIKTDKSVDKLFIETNAKEAKLYRTFANDARMMSTITDMLTRQAKLVTVLESDTALKAQIRTVIKKLQQLPI